MTPPPQESHIETGVVISFAQMYEAIQAVSTEVTKQGGTLKEINTKLDNLVTDTEDHESRIRTLEKKVWGASGLAGSLGGLLGYIASILR